MGTTRTRVWVLHGENIILSNESGFGARDGGFDGPEALKQRLSSFLEAAIAYAVDSGLREPPEFVVGAGMITSKEGLKEVPYLLAPAGLHELAQGVVVAPLSGLNNLKIALVPGIRTTEPRPVERREVFLADVIRGEETLCVGLGLQGRLLPGDVLITLGSHWKWIWTDDVLRIAGSRTTMTGELIHAIQENTLLASSLPKERPNHLDPKWVQFGNNEARKSGANRALFGIRLLEQMQDNSPDERLSFLYGIFLETEMEGLQCSTLWDSAARILISGYAPVAQAFAEMLQQHGKQATILPEKEREQAFLKGLLAIFRESVFGDA